MFQAEMGVLLRELKQRGTPNPEDQDIATQLCRVRQQRVVTCLAACYPHHLYCNLLVL
jgi:hypothetical protein